MCIIYVVEDHDQVLRIWRDHQVRSLKVTHLDAHCDMRGLLISLQSQRAYSILDAKTRVDPGNYLTHAVLESRVSSIQWVYDEPGGRVFDVGTVKYDSDLTAIPYRLLFALQGKNGIPLSYRDIPYSKWTGEIDGEYLDIDWDFFASILYPADTIPLRVEMFLKDRLRGIPEQIYVCYSPGFSHPSRDQFHQFIAELAQIYRAEVIEIQSASDQHEARPFYRKYLPPFLFRMARNFYYAASLRLRRWGIY